MRTMKSLILCLLAFVEGNAATRSGSLDFKDFAFDKLPTRYTGKIFPTPQKVEYSDKVFSLSSTAIALGGNFPKDDSRVRFLRDRIAMNGGRSEVVERDSSTFFAVISSLWGGDDLPPGKYTTVISLEIVAGGAPARPGAYTIDYSDNDGKNAVSVSAKDPAGLLWGVASLAQLIRKDNGVPSITPAKVSDYPDDEIRGFLSCRPTPWLELLPEYLVFTKNNAVVSQGGICDPERGFRDKKFLDPEKTRFMRFYGEMAKEWGFHIYYSLGSQAFFDRKLNHDERLRCSSEEDFKIARDIVGLVAENHCDFYLSFDDFRFPLHPDDAKAFGSAREADIYFANRLYREVKSQYPDFKMIFTPPFYWGPRSPAPYPEDREQYLAALGDRLDKEIDIFWVGPRVKFSLVTPKDAAWITSLIKRKPTLFQNGQGTPHIFSYSFITDPMTVWTDFTYPGFHKDMKAVFLNSQAWTNAVATATLADYSWNQNAYNANASARTAVGMFFGPENFDVLDNLNQKLSYFDVYGLKPSVAAAARIGELESKFKEVEAAYALAERRDKFALENLSGMKWYIEKTRRFVDKVKKTSDLNAFSAHIARTRGEAEKEAALTKNDIFLAPSDFIGGRGPADYGNGCPLRFATWIYGKKTANSVLRASFECEPFPPSGDYKLMLSGRQEVESDGGRNIAIKVNDKTVFSGPVDFGETGWAQKTFVIPASCLVRNNVLTIANMEDSAVSSGPPFFMLNYAVLRKPLE